MFPTPKQCPSRASPVQAMANPTPPKSTSSQLVIRSHPVGATNVRSMFESKPQVGRQVLRRLLDGPITVTPGAEGGSFAFFGQASFAKFDPDSGTIRPHNQEVAGRIERRSQEWCPRGDSNTRLAV